MRHGLLICSLLLGAAPLSWSAGVNDSDLSRCAQIGAPDARLACYDALAHRPAERVAAPPAAAAPPVAPVSPVTGSTETSNTVALDDPKNFGLNLSQLHTKDSGPKAINATISHLVSEQMGHAHVVLDNDEVWQVLDDDGALKEGVAVVIKRASLGSFIMTTPQHHAYRVHRLR